jgi:hypothetical protein
VDPTLGRCLLRATQTCDPVVQGMRTLSPWWIAVLFMSGCETALVVDTPTTADVVGGEGDALTVGPAAVRVVGGARAIAHARVVVRDRQGSVRRTTHANVEGVVAPVAADEVVVAAAPDWRPGSRLGPGLLTLADHGTLERLVVRREIDGRVVAEVVAGEAALPLADGLASHIGDAPIAPFTDLVGHPLAQHVVALWSRGVVAGDPDGRFRPNDILTRAEYAALLLALVGVPAPTAGSTEPAPTLPFIDVTADAWFAAPVRVIAQLGIMRGDPGGTFRPSDPVTRAEVAATLATMGNFNVDERTNASAVLRAPDVSTSHWAADALTVTQAFCHALDVDDDGALSSAS